MKSLSEKISESPLLNYVTMRKCNLCKEYITLEKEIDKYVYYKEKLYHIDCLKNKLKNKKIGKLSEEETEKLIYDLKEKSDNYSLEIMILNHLYKYLMDHYNVIMLPTSIYTKTQQMFSGEYKNMAKPIKPIHLLDMFIRKEKFLDNIYHKEKLDGVGKINYNLAVLCGKYLGYLDWLEKSKIENKIILEKISQNEVKINFLSNKVIAEKNNDFDNDIFSDIDD